ncbi:hypothetical protein E2C01_087250 [Portunus trituberculatus]|uniref:Uncharacterized protein n=1 Tax=Portunus trituberculatus TaxID=210409 RepID=A0A5B7JDK0_PORTR|nr:hypothetical protein [Portunus trituberculatus]
MLFPRLFCFTSQLQPARASLRTYSLVGGFYRHPPHTTWRSGSKKRHLLLKFSKLDLCPL